MPRCKGGDRVQMIGLMHDDPDPIEVGTKGTVMTVLNPDTQYEQIVVEWDSGRSLMLLPHDPFLVINE